MLTNIQRNFPWDWGSDGRKIAWVSWEKICKENEEGRLGVKEIRRFNKALPEKWKWRLWTKMTLQENY